MNRFFLVLVLALSLGAVNGAWAQDSEPAEIARVVGPQKVKAMDQKIKMLSKRITEGLKSGVLSQEKSDELKAEVKALWDKKKEFMEETGAKQITDVQLEKLQELWKQTAQKIYQAKHPGGKTAERTPTP